MSKIEEILTSRCTILTNGSIDICGYTPNYIPEGEKLIYKTTDENYEKHWNAFWCDNNRTDNIRSVTSF